MTKGLPSFEADREGLRQIQEAREPWRLASEFVANSWDEESVSRVTVSLTKNGKELANFRIVDNGDGFSNLSDAYTLFAPVPKRSIPDVRGRFNVGEKFSLSVARESKVETTSGWVAWDKQGKRSQGHKKRKNGTIITAKMPWTQEQVAETVLRLQQFMPPKGKQYLVNGELVPHRTPLKTVEATLATVILKEGAMRPSRRKTEIKVYSAVEDETPQLLEMGIPVQASGMPWHVSIEQKVPLSPNRESVSPGYMRDVRAEVLNVMEGAMDDEQLQEAWIANTIADDRVKDKTAKQIVTRRYPKTVFWSSDPAANERAKDQGFQVIHPRTISKEVKERLRGNQDYGSETGEILVKISSEEFGLDPVPYGDVEPTKGMLEVVDLVKRLGKKLLGFEPNVEFKEETHASESASWSSNGTLTFVVNKCGGPAFFNRLSGGLLGLIVHEFSHQGKYGEEGEPHDLAFRTRVDWMAGKALMLSLEDPKEFEL